jgi:type I restriction enzyme S subunit
MNGKGVVERRIVKGSEIASNTRFVVKTGQFIISRIDARHGASGLIPPELDAAVVTNDFPVFDIHVDRLYPRFFYWMTKTSNFVDLCRRASEGTTNRVRLSEKRLASMTIELPPLADQRRIAARLDELVEKLGDAIALRNTSSVALDALRQANSRRVFEQLGESKVPLQSVCATIIDNLHSNPVYSEDGTVPCIRSPDVGFGKLYLDTARKTSEKEYARRTIRGEPQADDIVLVREGGGTGKCALVTADQRFSLGQRVMMLRPDKSKVRPKYFLLQLLSPVIQADHIRPLSKGSGSPHLNIGALRRFPFVLPPLAIQDDFVGQLDAFHAKIDAAELLQTETDAEFAAILPAIFDKAFRGEL